MRIKESSKLRGIEYDSCKIIGKIWIGFGFFKMFIIFGSLGVR